VTYSIAPSSSSASIADGEWDVVPSDFVRRRGVSRELKVTKSPRSTAVGI
jgi:hypothetical protein